MVRASAHESNPDGGGLINADCKCHFVIESVEYRPTKEDVEVKSTVLACDDPSQVNKSHTEWLKVVGKGATKFFQMAIATGAICNGQPYTKDRWRADKENGVDPEIDETSMVGAQWMGKITMEEYEGKANPRVNFDIYHPLDEAVRDWPKDQQSFAILSGQPANNGGQPETRSTSTSPQASSPQRQPVASGSGDSKEDKWAGL